MSGSVLMLHMVNFCDELLSRCRTAAKTGDSVAFHSLDDELERYLDDCLLFDVFDDLLVSDYRDLLESVEKELLV